MGWNDRYDGEVCKHGYPKHKCIKCEEEDEDEYCQGCGCLLDKDRYEETFCSRCE